MEGPPYVCNLCGRDDFHSARTLTRHKLDKNGCSNRLKERFGSGVDYQIAAAHLPVDKVFQPQKCLASYENAMQYASAFDGLGAKRAKLMTLPEKEFTNAWLAKAQMALQTSQTEEDSGLMNAVYDSENEVVVAENGETSANMNIMYQNFQDYTKRANDLVPLDQQKILTAISLMQLLRRTKASLDTYEEMMRWHLLSQNLLHPRDSLAKSPHFVSRNSIYKMLKNRYNRDKGFGIKTEIVLPGSKARAKMITNDAVMVIQQLLIDPRVQPDDYLFNDKNDPFAPPSADLDYIADLNTGQSYIQTWQRLITKPGKQILCPILLYIDGAATGQFVDLPITAVKIALGIHTVGIHRFPVTTGSLSLLHHPYLAMTPPLKAIPENTITSKGDKNTTSTKCSLN